MENNLKPRKSLSKLKDLLKKERLIILLGSRQVGKTTLMKMVSPSLEGAVHSFDLERPGDLQLLNGGVAALKLRGVLTEGKKLALLIDEFQYLEDPHRLFKEIYDSFPLVTIIASGSSSIEIQKKIRESLAGRKLTLTVHPLDFHEYIQFMTPDRARFFDEVAPDGNNAFVRAAVAEFYEDFQKFIMYGGLPQIVLEPDFQTKQLRLEEIFTTYIQKDIKGLLKNIEIAPFNNLVQLIASQIGNLLNIAELSNTLRLSRRDITHYLEILQGTFVNFLLKPQAANKRTEVTKTPKTFFYDNGIRNQILKQFSPLHLRSDGGALLENAIFMELKKNLPVSQDLSFWRNKNRTEVDFVLRLNERLFPIEVKAGTVNHILPNIETFAKSHHVDMAFILNADAWSVKKKGGITYYWLPHFLASKIPEWVA